MVSPNSGRVAALMSSMFRAFLLILLPLLCSITPGRGALFEDETPKDVPSAYTVSVESTQWGSETASAGSLASQAASWVAPKPFSADSRFALHPVAELEGLERKQALHQVQPSTVQPSTCRVKAFIGLVGIMVLFSLLTARLLVKHNVGTYSDFYVEENLEISLSDENIFAGSRDFKKAQLSAHDYRSEFVSRLYKDAQVLVTQLNTPEAEASLAHLYEIAKTTEIYEKEISKGEQMVSEGSALTSIVARTTHTRASLDRVRDLFVKASTEADLLFILAKEYVYEATAEAEALVKHMRADLERLKQIEKDAHELLDEADTFASHVHTVGRLLKASQEEVASLQSTCARLTSRRRFPASLSLAESIEAVKTAFERRSQVTWMAEETAKWLREAEETSVLLSQNTVASLLIDTLQQRSHMEVGKHTVLLSPVSSRDREADIARYVDVTRQVDALLMRAKEEQSRALDADRFEEASACVRRARDLLKDAAEKMRGAPGVMVTATSTLEALQGTFHGGDFNKKEENPPSDIEEREGGATMASLREKLLAVAYLAADAARSASSGRDWKPFRDNLLDDFQRSIMAPHLRSRDLRLKWAAEAEAATLAAASAKKSMMQIEGGQEQTEILAAADECTYLSALAAARCSKAVRLAAEGKVWARFERYLAESSASYRLSISSPYAPSEAVLTSYGLTSEGFSRNVAEVYQEQLASRAAAHVGAVMEKARQLAKLVQSENWTAVRAKEREKTLHGLPPAVEVMQREAMEHANAAQAVLKRAKAHVVMFSSSVSRWGQRPGGSRGLLLDVVSLTNEASLHIDECTERLQCFTDQLEKAVKESEVSEAVLGVLRAKDEVLSFTCRVLSSCQLAKLSEQGESEIPGKMMPKSEQTKEQLAGQVQAVERAWEMARDGQELHRELTKRALQDLEKMPLKYYEGEGGMTSKTDVEEMLAVTDRFVDRAAELLKDAIRRSNAGEAIQHHVREARACANEVRQAILNSDLLIQSIQNTLDMMALIKEPKW